MGKGFFRHAAAVVGHRQLEPAAARHARAARGAIQRGVAFERELELLNP